MGKDLGQADSTVTLSTFLRTSLGAETGQTCLGTHYPFLNDSLASVGVCVPQGQGVEVPVHASCLGESQGPAWEVNGVSDKRGGGLGWASEGEEFSVSERASWGA